MRSPTATAHASSSNVNLDIPAQGMHTREPAKNVRQHAAAQTNMHALSPGTGAAAGRALLSLAMGNGTKTASPNGGNNDDVDSGQNTCEALASAGESVPTAADACGAETEAQRAARFRTDTQISAKDYK